MMTAGVNLAFGRTRDQEPGAALFFGPYLPSGLQQDYDKNDLFNRCASLLTLAAGKTQIEPLG